MNWRTLLFAPLAAAAVAAERNIGAIVLVDSRAPAYSDFAEFLQPYLYHFDIPYTVWDASRGQPPGAALLIAGHAGVRVAAIPKGTGLPG